MIWSSAQPGPPLDLFFPAELVKAMENVVPTIAQFLNDTDLGVRDSAVTALGKLSERRK